MIKHFGLTTTTTTKGRKNSPFSLLFFLSSFSSTQGIHFTEAARNALPGGRPQRPPGRALTLSTSLHSCAEVEAEAEAEAARRRRREESSSADATSTSYDYVFLSPIFESISKPGYGGGGGTGTSSSASAQFWEGKSEGEEEEKGSGRRKPSRALTSALASASAVAARESSLPTPPFGVVALGGVDASNLGLVRGLGFEAAAVLGAVWGSGSSSAEDPVEAWAGVVEAAAALS